MKKNLFLVIVLVIFQISLKAELVLTQEEKEFLKNNPKITLGTDKNWEPFTLVNSKGKIVGYDASVLELVNKLTGSNFVLKRGTWSNIQEEASKGKIYGLSTGIATKQRAQYLNFSKPYIKLEKIIFTNVRSKYKIYDVQDLENKIFAVDKNNISSLEYIKSLKNVKILKLNNSRQSINAVTTGQADAMLGNAAMVYILNKLGNPYLKPSFFPETKPLSLVFAVRKEYPEAISILNKALDEIGEQKLMQLKKFWFQVENKSNKTALLLDQKEKLYLKQKTINMCIDPNWMPFEKIKEGKHIGLSADFFEYIKNTLNADIKLIETKTWSESLKYVKDKRCDILSLAMKTPSRTKYLNFTTPYLDIPMVLATKNDVSFVDDLRELKGKKIGVQTDYAFAETLSTKYPYINLVKQSSTTSALHKVASGEIFGYIGSIGDIAYITQKNFIGEIKIAGKFDERLKLSIAVRNDDEMLLNIFQKAVDVVPYNFKQELLNKYIAVKYEETTDYALVIKVVLFFFILLLLIVYWNRKLSLANAKLAIAKEAIQKKNAELKRLSITDKLTGLYNRAKIDKTIEKELLRSLRYKHNLSIILIDIDYFKKVNDEYGHLVGDEILIEFAKILEENTRNTDIVGRWGGEEFLIVCPETDIVGALYLAKELQEIIQAHKFPKVEKKTASFGISSSTTLDNIDSLVLKADEALYKAKNLGRNRIEVFN